MRSLKLAFSFLIVLGIANVSAQLDIFTPPKPQPLWKADTMYIGASFTRASFDPVSVWLIGNEAGWTGNLYFIAPKTGQEVFLFTNHSTPNQKIILSDLYDIPVGDTVYFIYKVVTPANGSFPTEESRKPKYTGLNIPGVSRYVSEASSVKYGHRWSVAGRVNDSLVQFGFEDNVQPAGASGASDMDFDDIIFGTTLSLANAEVSARLSFTDKAGNLLAPGAFYSPASDSVYLVYTDDYTGNFVNGANPEKKEFVFKIRNRKGAAASDSETIIAGVPVRNGITGNWTLAVPIQEKPGIPGNKILESFFLGEVTATVKTHNRVGRPDGNTVTATLNIAYPDKPETVKIVSCPDTAADITRTTTCISIRVTDQSFTRNQDTVWAEVKCGLSGDVIGRVPMIEQAGGGYKSGDIVKNEAVPPNPGDNVLSCKTSDNITVVYVDEVYNNRVTDNKAWNGGSAEGLTITLPGNPAGQIATVKDGEADSIMIVVKGPSATVGVRDTILVTLTSAQGDKETVTAVETDVNSNVFTVVVGFGFQTTPAVAGSGRLEGWLDTSKAVTKVPVTAVAQINGKPYSATVDLLPALNLVKVAYIKDTDGDGRGDKVYIVFSRPLEVLPTSLTPTYWNSVDAEHDNDKPPVLSLKEGAPNVLVADFSGSPFPPGATSIALGQKPFATLPSDNIFGAQKPAINDSMGPIIVSATFHPFNSLAVTPGSTILNVDTMTIKVSEQLKTQSDWQELIRFSKTVNGLCTDYAHSVPVVPYSQPRDNGDGTFTFLVANGNGPSPLTGDCVYMNVNGTYTDLNGNLPPIHGEKLIGGKPPREIELFRGYPPVAGMNTSSPGFVVVNNDPQNDAGSEYSKKSVNGYVTVWVPPADFPAGFVPGTLYVPVIPAINAPVTPNMDGGKVSTMPPGISAVQVISTGEYIADVAIFDNLGNWVKSFKQAFGYRGELNNQERAAKRGMVSYLVWDLTNAKGQKAGQGVYVWKVVFRFKNGKQEIRYTRTGVVRNLTAKAP
ncbi:MAG: VWFA-related protein [Fibrobacteres bacterium]|nr:VWFA-related protein [Fibrobacterota bacterium]